MPSPKKPPPRIVIEDAWPQIDCGRYPPKRSVGQPVDAWATIVRDGHEVLNAAVRFRGPGQRKWSEQPMAHYESDRWHGRFEVTEPGRWQFQVAAWVDRIASWQHELQRKVDGGQVDLRSELAEGALLLGVEDLDVATGLDAMSGDRHELTTGATFEIDCDRERARFGSWYELFPRSWGGFKGVEKVLPELAKLGFDVVYLPPIHPIGTTNRKGRNNALHAEPGEPGSPWAIGGAEGGHDAIHPELGTPAEFDSLVERGQELGVEVCLDLALQCSPDHPWLKDHPDWFFRRPDGTLKYAENPPKRYQDIYNVNFDSEDWRALWDAVKDVVMHWCNHGVRVFRVDNPHTKPVAFWEWLIKEVRSDYPETVFLSEAFTRPVMMALLAKAGFSQSYTYFTWKNTKWELQEYMLQLTRSTLPEYFRPNFFVNTPDILHAYLQHGGPPAFHARVVLAATLSPSYGVYSGYEHFENVPVREGSEEYLDSEKYETKRRRLDGPLLPVIAKLNRARRENPALQRLDNVEFLETENEHLICYLKREPGNAVVTVVNLDPHNFREGVVTVPVALNLPPAYQAHDLLTDELFTWRIGRNYVGLEPGDAHVLRVE